MTSILVLLAWLALALAAEQPPQALVDSIAIETPHEFDFNKWAINKSLDESMVKLSQLLYNRLPKIRDPLDNIKAAKEILKEATSAAKRSPSVSEQVFRKALKTFIALERTDGQCTWRSYVILAENYVATESHIRRAMARVHSVVEHYLRRHAQKCRPHYRDEFGRLLESFDQEDLRRVQLCLSKPSRISDVSIIARGHFELSDEILGSMAERVVFLMKENSEWRKIITSSQPSEDHPVNASSSSTASVPMQSMFEKYLMGPCERYRKHFRSALVPVRFELAVEDDEQWDFLNKDEILTAGLKNYIICKSLLTNGGAKSQYMTVMQDAIDKLRQYL